METVTLNGVTYNQVSADGKIILEPVSAEKTYTVELTSKQVLILNDLFEAVVNTSNSPMMWFSRDEANAVTISPKVVEEIAELLGLVDIDELTDYDWDFPEEYYFTTPLVVDNLPDVM